MSNVAFLLVVASALLFSERIPGQSNSFTYQGRLTELGAHANGLYDFRFTAYDAQTLGAITGNPNTNSAVAVSNGLFTTTIDLGADVFTGPPRWLEIGVRTNGSSAEFQLLAGRQLVSPTPYALYALSAGAVSTPLSTSRTSPQTLHVDALAGDDSIQGRPAGRPFKSISNALAAAINGDVVHLKTGRHTNQLHYSPVYSYGYLFSGKSNITVRGDGPGTVVYGAGPGTFFGVGGNCENIIFRDFTIEGSKGVLSAGSWITNGLVAGIRFFGSNVRNCVVERVTMKNLPNHGIASFHSTDPENIIIRNCYFENGGATNGVVEGGLGADGAAIVLEGQRWQAIDNVIRNWARGIEIYSPRADLHGIVARGNKILLVPWQGVAVFPENGGRIYDSIITDNIIEGHPASSFAPLGMLLGNMERCTISGNRISRFAGGGIYAANTFLHNTISGNSVSASSIGITLWDVTAATNMAHNIISHNHIDATDHSGISVNGVNNSVLHNHITRPGRVDSGTPGIRIFLGSTNLWCSAIGNTIADAAIGISIESGVRTNRVFDNHMARVTTPVADAGTGTIIRDNTQ
jgi:parallel beta-helix repeat protein